jgi:hypothetical protein
MIIINTWKVFLDLRVGNISRYFITTLTAAAQMQLLFSLVGL